MAANICSSLASGSLQAQPAPGDSEVSRGVWSAFTSATVAGGSGHGAGAAAFLELEVVDLGTVRDHVADAVHAAFEFAYLSVWIREP
jgi:hypothetical protein